MSLSSLGSKTVSEGGPVLLVNSSVLLNWKGCTAVMGVSVLVLFGIQLNEFSSVIAPDGCPSV